MQARGRLEAVGNHGAQVHGAKRRAGSIPNQNFETGEHTGGQNPPCARSEPHHPNIQAEESSCLFAGTSKSGREVERQRERDIQKHLRKELFWEYI